MGEYIGDQGWAFEPKPKKRKMKYNCILCVRRKKCPKTLKQRVNIRKYKCPARLRRLRRADKS